MFNSVKSFKLSSRIREPHGREASGGLANPAAYASRLTSQMETLISPAWRDPVFALSMDSVE